MQPVCGIIKHFNIEERQHLILYKKKNSGDVEYLANIEYYNIWQQFKMQTNDFSRILIVVEFKTSRCKKNSFLKT